MKIAVLGAGSLGMLLAAKCSSVEGSEISVITRTKEQAKAIRQCGVTILEDGEETAFFPLSRAFSESSDPPDAEWLFLAVKQKDLTDELVRFISRCSRMNRTKIVCFQNGIGHIETLAEKVDQGKLYAAVTTEGAKRRSACYVEHTGTGITKIGRAAEADNQNAESEKLLIKFMKQAGFESLLSKHTHNILWNKLLINAVINPLTAILRIPNGELTASGHTLALMKLLFDEGKRVSVCAGAEIDGDLWEQLLLVCKNTAHNHSSMLQDIVNGRTTEVEWINGGIIRSAERYDLKVPAHKTVYHLVKELEP